MSELYLAYDLNVYGGTCRQYALIRSNDVIVGLGSFHLEYDEVLRIICDIQVTNALAILFGFLEDHAGGINGDKTTPFLIDGASCSTLLLSFHFFFDC